MGRENDAEWIKGELATLAKMADESAKEDRASARALRRQQPEKAERFDAMVSADTFYAKEIRRIISGKTWEEARQAKRSRRRHA